MKHLNIFLLLIIASLIFVSCDDLPFEPDVQFVQVDYKYNFNDQLNTFQRYYQKDLVIDGAVRTELWLNKEEQNRILEKANEINFFSLPDSMLNRSPVEIYPNPLQFLRIKNGEKENTVVWNYILPAYQLPGYRKLLELAEVIRIIVESKPEYLRLPQRNGGYD